jgi:hypothetical protein
MGNCLITKLKEVVDNNNLDFLGRVRIENDTDSVQKIRIDLADVDVNIKVVNGYLTDETGTQNYGTTAVNKAGDWNANTRYVTPGSIVYADKYINQGVIDFSMCYADISSLAYSKFNYFRGRCYGDCSKVKGDAVTFFSFQNRLSSNVLRSQAYGDLTYLLENNAATIKELCPRTRGNLTFNIENVNFSAGINIYGIPITVPSHDLSKLNGVYMFDRDATDALFDTWSGTLVSPYVVGLYNIRFATSEEIDRMFIENASKPIHPNATAAQKVIRILGGANSDITRTSASDEAVATLKAAGIDISINGVPQ